MLDGVRAAISTVWVATPWLGGSIALIVASTPMRNTGLLPRMVGGALTAGTIAGVWEYTYNSKDRPEIKWEVILGSAGIGAMGAAVGPPLLNGSEFM